MDPRNKTDGYRLIVSRDGDRVRLFFIRNGYDWSNRYPLIVEAARRIRIKQFVIDGEAVLLGVDGVSDFDGLHSRKHNDEVQLYAFDILALDGDDLRKLLVLFVIVLVMWMAGWPSNVGLHSAQRERAYIGNGACATGGGCCVSMSATGQTVPSVGAWALRLLWPQERTLIDRSGMSTKCL